jgi:hypothetical protein
VEAPRSPEQTKNAAVKLDISRRIGPSSWPERVDETIHCMPGSCRRCAHALAGEDSESLIHQKQMVSVHFSDRQETNGVSSFFRQTN